MADLFIDGDRMESNKTAIESNQLMKYKWQISIIKKPNVAFSLPATNLVTGEKYDIVEPNLTNTYMHGWIYAWICLHAHIDTFALTPANTHTHSHIHILTLTFTPTLAGKLPNRRGRRVEVIFFIEKWSSLENTEEVRQTKWLKYF